MNNSRQGYDQEAAIAEWLCSLPVNSHSKTAGQCAYCQKDSPDILEAIADGNWVHIGCVTPYRTRWRQKAITALNQNSQ